MPPLTPIIDKKGKANEEEYQTPHSNASHQKKRNDNLSADLGGIPRNQVVNSRILKKDDLAKAVPQLRSGETT